MSKSTIGYKKCSGYVVVLEITGETNESREDIVEPKYAKYRCSEANVLAILNLDRTPASQTTVRSDYDGEFMYTVGLRVVPHYWDPHINEVCSGGIHYFKRFKVAKMYNFVHSQVGRRSLSLRDAPKFTGVLKNWYDNGQLMNKRRYVNSRLNGQSTDYHPNGKVSKECVYEDDLLHGEYAEYHLNGVLAMSCSYKNGIVSSPEIDYFYETGTVTGTCDGNVSSGNLRAREQYKNGIRTHRSEWFLSGRIKSVEQYSDQGLLVSSMYNRESE